MNLGTARGHREAKRAREREEAAAYERLKEELAGRRGVGPHADLGDAPESEESEAEEEEQSNLQLDALDDFCRGPGLRPKFRKS